MFGAGWDKKNEPKSIDEILSAVEGEKSFYENAEKIIEQARVSNAVFASFLHAPQSVDKHAEGPILEDHLRCMLIAVSACVAGKLKFFDIQEFRAYKNYEAKFAALENLIRENPAFFEAYALCHDLGKRDFVFFHSIDGGEGEKLGFNASNVFAVDEDTRRAFMAEYDFLYKKFEIEHSVELPHEIQAKFFKAYKISISNTGHAKAIYAEELESAARATARALRVPEQMEEMMIELIAVHMEALSFARGPDAKLYNAFYKLAARHGFNPAEFLDLMQATMFLDSVAGTKKRASHGFWRDYTPFLNFIISEFEWAPDRARQLKEEMEASIRAQRRAILKEAGLDGNSLIKLTGMKQSKELGILAKEVEAAFLSGAEVKTGNAQIESEIADRILKARAKLVQ